MSKRKKDRTASHDNPDGDHIEFSAEVLADAVALLKLVVLKRAIRKDYASFHFTASAGGVVTISATDERIKLQLRVEAMRVVGVGTVMIDAHALTTLLGSYKEPRVRIHLADARSEVRFEGLQAKLRLPAYDPLKELKSPVPGCLARSGWFFQARDLTGAIGRVKPFVDEAATRYALSGAFLTFPEGDGPAELVTTDGRRLARALVPVVALGDPERRCHPAKGPEDYTGGVPILPIKALLMTERLARRHGDERVGIAVIPGAPIDLERNTYHPGQIQIVTRDAVLTTLSVEGRFPDYRAVLPEGEPRCEATVHRASALAELVGIAAATVNSESKGVDVTLAGGGIMLMSESNTRGQSQLFLADVPMTGQDTFVCDAVMLRQLLDVLGDRPVVIQSRGPKEAVVFVSGSDWLGVQMPLTTDDPRPTGPSEPVAEVADDLAKGPVYFNGDEDDEPEDGGDIEVVPVEPEPVVPVASRPDAPHTNGYARPGKKRQ